MNKPHKQEEIIKTVHCWLQTIVINLNLCPFAKYELLKNQIRFFVSEASTKEQLLIDLQTELKLLNNDTTVETTLLIHPNVLGNFCDYNQFLNDADDLLIQMQLEGIYQIASFHPNYQFANTQPDDTENYTNRSPYPILHLLREDSIEQAIANYPNPEAIPEQNIARLNQLGQEKIHALFKNCFNQIKH